MSDRLPKHLVNIDKTADKRVWNRETQDPRHMDIISCDARR